LRKIGAINLFAFWCERTCGSADLEYSRHGYQAPFDEAVNAVLIEPGVRFTFGPIVFTGKALY